MYLLFVYLAVHKRPALNEISVLQHFERNNVIEIRIRIMFDFYPGLPHTHLKLDNRRRNTQLGPPNLKQPLLMSNSGAHLGGFTDSGVQFWCQLSIRTDDHLQEEVGDRSWLITVCHCNTKHTRLIMVTNVEMT